MQPELSAVSVPSAGAGRLIGVLVAAACFRAAYYLQYRAESVFATAPILDAAIYDSWARQIAAGYWRPIAPFYFAPGYAYLLALIHRFVASMPAAVQISQLALGVLNIALICRLGAAAFDRRVGTLAAVIAALYAPLPFFETKLMAPTVALTLWLLSLVMLAAAGARGAAWRWALAGGLLGATSLVRSETLMAAPFVVLWIAMGSSPREGSGGAGALARWRSRLSASAVLMASWTLIVLPAVLHNVRSGGGVTLISSQGGITFYQGNNPAARGHFTPLWREGFSGMPERQAAEEKAIAEQAAGRQLSRSETSAYWFRRGFEFMGDDPVALMRLLFLKLLRFLSSHELSTEYDLYVERGEAWLLWLPFVPFGLIVALALPGIGQTLIRAGSERSGENRFQLSSTGWLLLASIAANLLVVLTFYVSSRYRLPSVPAFITFASATLVFAVDAVRQRQGRHLWAQGTVVLLVFCVASVDWAGVAAQQRARAHYNAGNLLSDVGDDAGAVTEFRRALALDDSGASWFRLAECLDRLHRAADAASAFGEAARRSWSPFQATRRRAEMLERAGDLAGAQAAYEQAATFDPNDFEVQLGLGRVARQNGHGVVARQHLSRALTIRPDAVAVRTELEEVRSLDYGE
jgi:tetratricopeptide (TPR) repeat protein